MLNDRARAIADEIAADIEHEINSAGGYANTLAPYWSAVISAIAAAIERRLPAPDAPRP